MAEVSVFLRASGNPHYSEMAYLYDRYFIVLELTSDCFFRWVRTTDSWYKLLPRVPIQR